MKNFSFYFRNVIYLIVLYTFFSGARADSLSEFFRAVENDDTRTVSSLLLRGFDPNAVDAQGQNALYLALRAESPKVFNFLMANPQTKFDAANTVGETPLMMAALRGNLEACKVLLAKGATVNREGWSPLHYAASGPNSAVVTLLLDAGARIDAESPNRSTPLMMAARYGAEPAVDVLLRRGADPKRRNDLNLSAADFARQGERDALAERLLPLTR